MLATAPDRGAELLPGNHQDRHRYGLQSPLRCSSPTRGILEELSPWPRMTSRRPSPALPPHVDATDPRTLKWRLDQIEERVQALEDQPTAIEMAQRLPWERVVLPLVLVIALKAGWISADIVQSLLGR